MSINNIRNKFPFFKQNPEVIYFDNASTTQKPQVVLDAMNSYFADYCSNAGRGSYTSANLVTHKVEEVRDRVKSLINATSTQEIVFTSGATAGLNTIAYAWGLNNLQSGDEIMVCLEDHDSNILPWLNLKKVLSRLNIHINIVPFKNTLAGDADIDDIISKISSKTKLIALTHIHNVYGTRTEVEKIKKALNNSILISLDASQSVGHIQIDVHKLGVDFLAFSGHKMFASTGVGVLWINQNIQSTIHPFIVGGGVVEDKLENEKRSFKKLPFMLEGGTQNIAGIISLGAAIDFINEVGVDYIQQRIMELARYLLDKLLKIEKIEFLQGPAFCLCEPGCGVISFNLANIPSSEIGFVLNDNNIYVRTGTHCTGGGNQLNDSVRVSLHIYNTEKEIDKFIEVLKEIRL